MRCRCIPNHFLCVENEYPFIECFIVFFFFFFYFYSALLRYFFRFWFLFFKLFLSSNFCIIILSRLIFLIFVFNETYFNFFHILLLICWEFTFSKEIKWKKKYKKKKFMVEEYNNNKMKLFRTILGKIKLYI